MNTDKKEPLIRVLIMDSEYQSYYHPSVSLSWQGQEYVFGRETGGEEELSCTFEGGTEGIRISSVKREQGAPVYRGTIKITKNRKAFLFDKPPFLWKPIWNRLYRVKCLLLILWKH